MSTFCGGVCFLAKEWGRGEEESRSARLTCDCFLVMLAPRCLRLSGGASLRFLLTLFDLQEGCRLALRDRPAPHRRLVLLDQPAPRRLLVVRFRGVSVPAGVAGAAAFACGAFLAPYSFRSSRAGAVVGRVIAFALREL